MTSSSPSFSTTTTSKARRYDVFLSFRGEDTRKGFTSHLREALSKNQIFTFIDNNLKRGDDIYPSLLTAIEESMISVIIFSEDYAGSKSCLKELAKILQCRELNAQIVIPVFYGVDPSHIRNQTEEVGIAFDKRKESIQEWQMDLNEVRSHLEKAANMSGWVSQAFSSESKLIEAIVGDVLNKLNLVTMNLPTSFVGISSHIEGVETLLCLDSPKFRIVGIWGMGGIGKTTIAQAIFNRIYSRFDGFHFAENVSKELKSRTVNGLREEIVLKLFEEERLKMGNRTLRHDFIMKQLQRKKVLLVLDDLDDVLLAKKLIVMESHLFCDGSRVLVTSRDKQVLKNIVGDENQIYEVKGMNEEDGLQLFSLGAFKQNHPTSDRLELSKKVLSYARGNPLALVVLGCALFDKSKEEWVSALDGLGDEPFPDIQKVLRISYDALSNEEKMIFLDISAFLVGKKLDFVAAYYEGSVRKIVFKIRNLVDKSLVTIAKDEQLEMHDLLKEMGRFIESDKRLEERIRIWDLKDLIHVSKKMKGSSMIEAISVNLCQGERISEFDCTVFAKLDCLRFLEFHDHAYEESKVRFCWERFRGFSEELRYFRWDAYPQNSLPSNFCVENLVELHMSRTRTRELWTGKQNIVSLKVINLERADKLVEFPDVSEGRNIERIDLYGCKNLVNLPPSIQHLPKLEILVLAYCSSLESVPTTFDSKVLKVLNLRCTNLESFPEIMKPMESLKRLYLSGCTRLRRLPNDHSFHNLKSLEKLHLDDTAITELPSSIQHLICLQDLDISGCQNLTSLPSSIHNLRNLWELNARGTGIVDLHESIGQLFEMRYLDLSGCKRLRSLPANMKQISQLLRLSVAGCLNLSSLPELPSSLERLNANGCISLKTIPSACFASESKTRILKFANCFNWDEEERRRVLDIGFPKLHYSLDRKGIPNSDEEFQMMLPWNTEMPQWFCGSQSVGSSLTLKLPMDDQCYRFAFCVVIKPYYADSIKAEDIIYDVNYHHIYDNYMNCYVDDDAYEHCVTECGFHLAWSDTEHLSLWHHPGDELQLRKYFGREVSFEFRDKKGKVEVTRCGVVIF